MLGTLFVICTWSEYAAIEEVSTGKTYRILDRTILDRELQKLPAVESAGVPRDGNYCKDFGNMFRSLRTALARAAEATMANLHARFGDGPVPVAATGCVATIQTMDGRWTCLIANNVTTDSNELSSIRGEASHQFA